MLVEGLAHAACAQQVLGREHVRGPAPGDRLAREPTPVVIAISGEAGPEESFELAKRGVCAFLAKPITLDELEEAIAVAVDHVPSVSTQVRQLVGHRSLHEMTTEVRETMINEALARSSGSLRGAARLLDTSRQLLQYIRRKQR